MCGAPSADIFNGYTGAGRPSSANGVTPSRHAAAVRTESQDGLWGGKLPRFHAEATRNGAEWVVHVTELKQSVIARSRHEITAKACALLKASAGIEEGQ